MFVGCGQTEAASYAWNLAGRFSPPKALSGLLPPSGVLREKGGDRVAGPTPQLDTRPARHPATGFQPDTKAPAKSEIRAEKM
jgi:hypothetical protein